MKTKRKSVLREELKTRKRKRKTETKYTIEDLKAAMKLVSEDQWSQNQAAKEKGIPVKTLNRYIQKQKEGYAGEELFAQRGARTIFSPELEKSFVDYIKYHANNCYRMTTLDVRRAAYQLAVSHNIDNLPSAWEEKKMAGTEWFLGFRERHPSINFHQPEGCSLG